MMKNLVLAAALAGVSGVAMAGPSQGDWEIVFSNAGGGLATTGDETNLGVGVRAGYFLDSNHEVGGGADFLYFDDEEDSGETLNLAAFYRYNLATADSKDWFYGGVELELLDVTDSDFSTEVIRPHVGKKWMLSEDVAFDLNGGVMIPTESDADEVFDVRFGLTIFY